MKRSNAVWLLGTFLLVLALAITGFYLREADLAGEHARETYEALVTAEEQSLPADPDPAEETGVPDWMRIPGLEMPTVEVDGVSYIGTIEIPGMERVLPVAASCDPLSNLETGPCLYAGSLYGDNAVICGHSYASHFGFFEGIHAGAPILFRDTEGNLLSYVVTELDVIDGHDVDGMLRAGPWDLTLFTCAPWHTSRLVLRCARQ